MRNNPHRMLSVRKQQSNRKSTVTMSYKMRINCLKFSSLAIFLLFLQTGFAQGNRKNVKELGTANFPQLDELVQKNQKLFSNAAALVWTDTLVYKRELGDFDTKTLAPLGASSEWLTAALVMKFVEAGKISLDDKISKYLPTYELYGKNYITIRHCLTHFTGIQQEGGIFSKKKYASLEEEVNSYAKKEIKTNPGTEFVYSHIGLSIAGRILEVVSKKKFDMLIKQQLFNPLAMRKSTFGTLDNSAIDPSEGGQSTADEYMHFLVMLLNNGQYNGQQILSAASVQELRRIETKPELVKSSPKATEGLAYAMGSWVLGDNNGTATALACPSLSGVFPVVDWCHGYALLLIEKAPVGEQKKEPYMQMKDAVDNATRSKCK